MMMMPVKMVECPCGNAWKRGTEPFRCPQCLQLVEDSGVVLKKHKDMTDLLREEEGKKLAWKSQRVLGRTDRND